MVATNSTNTYIVAPTTWEVTMPKQPSFCATIGGAQDNVTGDGTGYECQFTSEIMDQGGDYDGTSRFTAPVTGVYFITVAVRVDQVEAAMTQGYLKFDGISNTQYYRLSPANFRDSADEFVIRANVVAKITAASEFYASIQFFSGNKVVDIVNAESSYISGTLLC